MNENKSNLLKLLFEKDVPTDEINKITEISKRTVLFYECFSKLPNKNGRFRKLNEKSSIK